MATPMREACALIRAAWLTAASYRVGMILSIVGLAGVVVPLYFIANALQPAMAGTIAAESSQYFAFVIIGAVTFSLVATSATALPGALDGAIGRGTLEVILGTPARLPAVCVGLIGYAVLWSLLRAAILVAVALLLGTRIVWPSAGTAIAVLAMTMLCYVGISLVIAALILTFRTAGPLTTGVLTGSMFLGGVYYPARVIPSWIRELSDVTPLTYGLRAVRQLLLRGDGFAAVSHDVAALALMMLVSLALGTAAFVFALAQARRAGTLATY